MARIPDGVIERATGRYEQSDPRGLGAGWNTYVYANANTLRYVDPLGLWALTLQWYRGYGGAVVITGHGLQFDSIGFRAGVGAGIGVELNPWGKGPDPAATCGSDSIGVFAEVAAGAGPFGLGLGYNYGGTQRIDDARVPHWTEYGGREPEFGLGETEGGLSRLFLGIGVELEGSAGIEVTHNF